MLVGFNVNLQQSRITCVGTLTWRVLISWTDVRGATPNLRGHHFVTVQQEKTWQKGDNLPATWLASTLLTPLLILELVFWGLLHCQMEISGSSAIVRFSAPDCYYWSTKARAFPSFSGSQVWHRCFNYFDILMWSVCVCVHDYLFIQFFLLF